MMIFEVILIVYSFINLIVMIKNYKKFYCIYPVIAVFDLVMVVPLMLEIMLGIPDIPADVYSNFIDAMEDQTTLLIYCCFILLAQVAFSFELRRIRKKDIQTEKTNDIQEFLAFVRNFRYRNVINLICYVVVLACILSIVLSPSPIYYLSFRNVNTSVSAEISNYTENIVSPLFELLFVAIIALKLFDAKNKRSSGLFRFILIIFFTIVNGKRTNLMIIVAIYFLIDLLREGSIKKIAPKYIVLFGAVVVYFFAYMYITDKISYNSDWYYELHEYIFRSMHVRFSIYAVLNPDKIQILDYPGQSMIYSLLFFIPRSIWTSKPYPYIDYYMKALLNLNSLSAVTYHMPASYYPEFVSNFGLLGLPFSIIFTIWITRFFDRRKTVCKLLGAALIALLNVYYYNDLLKIVAIFILFLYIKEKFKFVSRRK